MRPANKYIWRGYELSDESIVIQSSVDISYKGFGLNIRGNIDTDYNGATDSSEFNETDLSLHYEKNFNKIITGLGYIYYGLDSVLDSQEI